MIRHTVVFTPEACRRIRRRKPKFLADALEILAAIPRRNAISSELRQVSPKNDYRFGFSMEFAGPGRLSRATTTIPDHVAFVRDRWVPEVEAFLEIDYVPLLEHRSAQNLYSRQST